MNIELENGIWCFELKFSFTEQFFIFWKCRSQINIPEIDKRNAMNTYAYIFTKKVLPIKKEPQSVDSTQTGESPQECILTALLGKNNSEPT